MGLMEKLKEILGTASESASYVEETRDFSSDAPERTASRETTPGAELEGNGSVAGDNASAADATVEAGADATKTVASAKPDTRDSIEGAGQVVVDNESDG